MSREFGCPGRAQASRSISLTSQYHWQDVVFLFLTAAVVLLPVIEATTSMASSTTDINDNNSAIGKNNLGQLTRACAEAYCVTGVSGLDLWISFEEVCLYSTNQPYFQALGGLELTSTFASWSFGYTNLFCSIVAMVGLFTGFQAGARCASPYKK